MATEARTKFDSYLQMHLSDPKPLAIQPARRIKRGKDQDHVKKILETTTTSHAPPVTCLLAAWAQGKSTYLKHFEKISGSDLLTKRSCSDHEVPAAALMLKGINLWKCFSDYHADFLSPSLM